MARASYSYPLAGDWSVAEINTVIHLYNCVEQAYEGGIPREDVLTAYHNFKTVVNAKSQEKQLSRQFEKVSGYSIYQTVKAAQEGSSKRVRLNEHDR